eukprot:4552058-Pyramimonas_sp.AAC.1
MCFRSASCRRGRAQKALHARANSGRAGVPRSTFAFFVGCACSRSVRSVNDVAPLQQPALNASARLFQWKGTEKT